VAFGSDEPARRHVLIKALIDLTSLDGPTVTFRATNAFNDPDSERRVRLSRQRSQRSA
jgi:hypothetical protein